MSVATCIEAPKLIVRRNVTSTDAIPKGTLMYFEGAANHVLVTDGTDNRPFAGIAVEEKVSTETDVTTIGCALDGVWDIDNSGSIAIGEGVSMFAANTVIKYAAADHAFCSFVGVAEEAEVSDNRARVRLRGY